MSMHQTTVDRTKIEVDPTVPAILITRDFAASPRQLLKAHTDPDIVPRWLRPAGRKMRVDYSDVRKGGTWRYVGGNGEEVAFHGRIHEISDFRLVETFTYERMPGSVTLETMWFEDLGHGRTRVHAKSLCDCFEARNRWLTDGVDSLIDNGYAKLDAMIAEGAV